MLETARHPRRLDATYRALVPAPMALSVICRYTRLTHPRLRVDTMPWQKMKAVPSTSSAKFLSSPDDMLLSRNRLQQIILVIEHEPRVGYQSLDLTALGCLALTFQKGGRHEGIQQVSTHGDTAVTAS